MLSVCPLKSSMALQIIQNQEIHRTKELAKKKSRDKDSQAAVVRAKN